LDIRKHSFTERVVKHWSGDTALQGPVNPVLFIPYTKSDDMNGLDCASLHCPVITQYTLAGIGSVGTSNKSCSSCHSIHQHHSTSAALVLPSPSAFWRESPPTASSPTRTSLPNVQAFLRQEIAPRKLLGQHGVWSVRRHCIRISHSSKHRGLGNKRQSTKLADDSHWRAWLSI